MVGARGTTSTPGLVLSAAGRELLDRLAGEEVSADRALALTASLRGEYPPELVAAALTQQALRTAGRAKFSRADEMLFTRSGLEQASSELTARHAAARFAGARSVADLCCGIGGNLAALADPVPAGPAPAGSGTTTVDFSQSVDSFQSYRWKEVHDHERRVVGVDADPTSLEFARHNVSVCAPSAQAGFVRADVRQLPLRGIDAAFIDPARRDGHRRLPAGQYQPPLSWCLRLADTVPRVGIKAAPGLRRDLVPPGWETEFVAVGRELKEALLWSPALALEGVTSRATVLPSGDTLTSPGLSATSATTSLAELLPVPLAPPGAYLFDPSPAVTRAGLVAELARLLGAWQIDPMIAFLSCDEPIRTPFARTLLVLDSAPWHEKRFARRLRELGIGSADIRRRGLAGDVALIHRRLGLRGSGAATIVLTRVADRPWGLICGPPSD